MKQQILEHLQHLVAFDTQNPPRAIEVAHPVFDYLRHALGGEFEFELTDHELGRVSLLAMRGSPGILFNVHLDTVPFGERWTRPPERLTIEGKRAFGRGVCDIKGAAAALVAAATASENDVAILFTTDEEGTENCCVSEFCNSNADRFEFAVVAEPTECRAVVEHRGYLSVVGTVDGVAGHTSRPGNLLQSANHRAVAWCAAAIDQIEKNQLELNRTLCFNIGQLNGGSKNNVVADSATIGWSIRTPSGTANQEMFEQLTRGEESGHIDWRESFSAPALPVEQEQKKSAERFVADLALEKGDPVDFWTEAALFSQARIPAIVLGPGNIAQAHTADEWIEVDQLVTAADIYAKIQRNK